MKRSPGIRLLCLDLDGTVVGPGLTIRPRVQAAVREARERGVTLVVATGRMYRTAAPLAARLGAAAPLICYQGAYVREPPDADGSPGAILRHRAMRVPVARDAIRWARERGFEPHLNLADELVMEMGDRGADYERAAGISVRLVPDLLRPGGAPTKVVALGLEDLPARHLAAARAEFEGRAQVTVSHPEYLEWTAPGVHKGRALRWLARRLRVPMAQVMAVGDQFNDLEMLAMAGHGVAMGGAPPEVRAAARYVTSSWHEDGVALAIEALLLGRGGLD